MLDDIKATNVNLVGSESEQTNYQMPEKTLTRYYTSNSTVFTKKSFKYSLPAAITMTLYLGFEKT